MEFNNNQIRRQDTDPLLMTERERQLLNDYHQKIYEVIGPHLNEEERAWLKEATRAI